MNIKLIAFVFLFTSVHHLNAQQAQPTSKSEQEIIELSKQKWQWMSDKNADALSSFFDTKCDIVHMGGTWGKDREVEIIKNGFIWYKKTEVYSTAENFLETQPSY